MAARAGSCSSPRAVLSISLTPLREWLINAIPMNLKLGIAAGIGLFLALIGLQNAGLVAGDFVTLVKLGDLSEAKVLLAVGGFLLIAGLAARKVPAPSSSACLP